MLKKQRNHSQILRRARRETVRLIWKMVQSFQVAACSATHTRPCEEILKDDQGVEASDRRARRLVWATSGERTKHSGKRFAPSYRLDQLHQRQTTLVTKTFKIGQYGTREVVHTERTVQNELNAKGRRVQKRLLRRGEPVNLVKAGAKKDLYKHFVRSTEASRAKAIRQMEAERLAEQNRSRREKNASPSRRRRKTDSLGRRRGRRGGGALHATGVLDGFRVLGLV